MDSFADVGSVSSSDTPYRLIGVVLLVAAVVGLVVWLLVGCPRYPLAVVSEGFQASPAQDGLRRLLASCDQGRGESRELVLLLEKCRRSWRI